jgi:ATP-binding cassette subfamily B protein
MIPSLRQKITSEGIGMLMDKSHDYYQNHFSGSLTNKINDLTTSVPELLQIVVDRFFSHALAVAIAIITLSKVSLFFSSFLLIWTAVFITGAMLFSKQLTVLSDQWSEYGSKITGRVVDALSNILSIQLFAGRDSEKQLLSQTLQDAVNAEKQLQWGFFWMWLCYGLSAFLVNLLSFYFLCKGYQDGWVTIGDFVLVLGINNSVFDFL